MEHKNKKSIITISGRPGSGKSTASREIASRLGYEHFSSGDLFRAIAREKGIDVLQANLLAEEEREIDHLVDQRLRDIGEQQNDVAIDSRMAWYWIPQSFKVFLDLDLDVAARRIIAHMDEERLKHEHIPSDPHDFAQILQARLNSETGRYRQLYDADPYNSNNYDLVLHTEKYDADAAVDEIIAQYQKWLKS